MTITNTEPFTAMHAHARRLTQMRPGVVTHVAVRPTAPSAERARLAALERHERELAEFERLKAAIARMRPGPAKVDSERRFKRLVRLYRGDV